MSLSRARAGLALTPLTFGSMRIDRAGGLDIACDLISMALDLGVFSFHASVEYETWPLFAAAFRQAKAASRGATLIGKVGVPHFGERAFDPQGFRRKIDQYRQELDIERVEVVQWLLRYDLKDEQGRLEIFDHDGDLVAETVQALRREGAIGGFLSFPYTRGLAERALAAPWCDGLALYCNVLELEMADQFDRALSLDKAIVAIRPFAAGRVFSEAGQTAAEAVALPLHHPATVSVVASVSTAGHLGAAVQAAFAPADLGQWRRETDAGDKHV